VFLPFVDGDRDGIQVVQTITTRLPGFAVSSQFMQETQMKHDTTKYKNKHLFLFIRILATSE
jgi:hypothetical protein